MSGDFMRTAVPAVDTLLQEGYQVIVYRYYSILFYSILFYSILFYSILFYSILFYSILFYSILFYSIFLLFCSSYSNKLISAVNLILLLMLFASMIGFKD